MEQGRARRAHHLRPVANPVSALHTHGVDKLDATIIVVAVGDRGAFDPGVGRPMRLPACQFSISEIAYNSASDRGRMAANKTGVLVANARSSIILRHTNHATIKVAGLG